MRAARGPTPLAAGLMEGVAAIPASVGLGVREALDSICFQLECSEQVLTAEGTVSLAQTRRLVLDCGGTGSCASGTGTVQPGEPCDEIEECIPGSVCFNKYCVGEGRLRVSLAFEVDSDFDIPGQSARHRHRRRRVRAVHVDLMTFEVSPLIRVLSLALTLGASSTLVFGSACYPRAYAGDPSTTGDSPRLNRATSAPVKDVPYCSGGQRDSTCLFGANCRVTNEGCQVCQCLAP